MSQLDGIKVIELAIYGFVPSAGAVLADWGGDIIKVTDPTKADPIIHLGEQIGYQFLYNHFNRGKRSVGIDLRSQGGHELFLDLVRGADVLITSFREPAREVLAITYDQLKKVNPRLIYARGHGQGQHGPDANDGGFDGVSYWARGGVGHMYTEPDAEQLTAMRPAMGDVMAGMALAGAVAAALHARNKTGEGSLIDVSLLSIATWQLAPDVLKAKVDNLDPRTLPSPTRSTSNPLANWYRTADDRFLRLSMNEPDRFWQPVCSVLDLPELRDDPKYQVAEQRAQHGEALVAALQKRFLELTLADVTKRLDSIDSIWSAVQTPLDVVHDEQVVANNYIVESPAPGGNWVVASPAQFNDKPVRVKRSAPLPSQHTDEVLAEFGVNGERVARLRSQGAIS